MKNTTALFSILIKERLRSKGASFGLKSNSYAPRRKTHILFWAVMAVCFLPLLTGIAIFAYGIGGTFSSVAGGALLFTDTVSAAVGLGQIAVLLVGLVSIVTTLYQGSDNEILLALPIKPSEIFTAKFMCVYVFEFGTSLLVTLFVLLPLGLGYGAGIAFYAGLILITLLLPILPMLIAAVVGIPVMLLVSALKGKGPVAIILMVVCFAALFVGYYYVFYKVMPDFGEMSAERIVEILSGFVRSAGEAIYPNLAAARMITATDFGTFLLNFAITVGIDAALLFLGILLSSKVYRKIVSGGSESGKTSRKKGRIAYGSLNSELVKRDVRTIMRYPAMGFVCVMQIVMSVLIPVAFSMVSGASSGAESTFGGFSEELLFLMCTGMMVFVSSTNVVASGAFSREGGDMALLKSLPVKPKDIVRAKLVPAYVTDFVSVLLGLIVFGVGRSISFPLVIVGIITAFSASVFGSAVSVYVDMKSPRLVWRTPNEAMKNSPSQLVGMLVGFLSVVLMGIFGFLGYLAAGSTEGAVFLLVAYGGTTAVMVAASVFALKKLFGSADKLYHEIQP